MNREAPSYWRKWIYDVLFTAVSAAAGTALLVAVIVLVNDLRLTGSAADWLAAVCNAVVAAAAVGAFLVARSWLPQLTTLEGYKEALKLVNELFSQLITNYPLLSPAEQVMYHYREHQRNSPTPRLEPYREALNNLYVFLQAEMIRPADD